MNYYLSLAALVPAVILFVRIYQLDRIEKEPRRLMKGKHLKVRFFYDRRCFFQKASESQIFLRQRMLFSVISKIGGKTLCSRRSLLYESVKSKLYSIISHLFVLVCGYLPPNLAKIRIIGQKIRCVLRHE